MLIGSGLFKATLAAVKEISRLEAPADMMARDFFVRNREIGRRDRHWISETLFDILRNRRLYSHWTSSLGGAPERSFVLTSMFNRGLFDEGVQAYAKPLELTARDQEWITSMIKQRDDPNVKATPLRPQVEASLPDWAYDLMVSDHGTKATLEIGRAALKPAPLDLRINTGKATREQVQANLLAAGIEAEIITWLPNALRVRGKPALDKTTSFQSGEFEVQDAGSQWLAHIVNAKRGQTVVDFCAGAGGKTLALADMMRNSGQIYALDISAARLNRMRPRLARSGATNVQPMLLDSEHDPKLKRFNKKADCVLVDSPCSGSGTWRRNPDLKWRQQPAGLSSLQEQQLSILTAASLMVRPGGKLIYSTCSLFSIENRVITKRFLEKQAKSGGDFELAFEAVQHPVTLEKTSQAQLLPHQVDADGFFVCVFTRKVEAKSIH
jgi:16S rRNA (cytosine967-C5)-methyltransferase